ncbi:class I adenylate-forming enzyme family protein [Nocardia sp. 348MFTsu5.1]|uniref:class I adenylate-forming enzyme family protein n=1 Tax=Nocardia sp. 348MFTsu5.1 TaxID=1172185 RepID=UPI000360379D|nr:AMP-binding protein [Nocardia sp. 348MFTsu5.1]
MTAALESISLYRELESELTGPDGPFALANAEVRGESMLVYRNAPAGLDAVFGELVETYADNTLLIEGGVEYTYRQVADQAAHLAGALVSEYGVGSGSRVGVLMKNQLAYVVSIMAIARCGAAAVLFNSRESVVEIGHALADAGCSVVIADDKRARLARSAESDVPLVVVGEEPPSGDTRLYSEVVSGSFDRPAPVPADPESLCLILFTSGTSGRSKGVLLTQRNVCTMVMNLRMIKEINIHTNARKYGMEPDALRGLMPSLSALLIFPLFHTSGLVSLLTSLTSGGFVVIQDRWDAEGAIELIEKHKLAMLAGPPMVITDLLAANPRPEAVASLVNVAPAGQATPPDLVNRINQILPAAGRSVGWGMTEAAGSVCTAGGDLLAAYPGSSGPPCPVMSVRVVGTAGTILPAGEVGELEVRGPLVMAGYLDRPAETAAAFDGSWYRSGDLGYLDNNGLVFVVDRKKDMVISAGENIYCAEVEHALMASDKFVEVTVFGVPDNRRGEVVVAAVAPREGESLTETQVQDIVRGALAEYKVPAAVVFDLAPFPRSATGKILKRKVREQYSG